MANVINNPSLVNLIGRKFHVRNVEGFEEYPKQYRATLKAHALNEEMFIYSISFNADTPPEIGLVKDLDSPDALEYYKPWQLVFSAPKDSPSPLPAELFDTEGALIALISQPEAA